MSKMKSLYLIEYREGGRWQVCTVSRSLPRARGIMQSIRRESAGKVPARVTKWVRPIPKAGEQLTIGWSEGT